MPFCKKCNNIVQTVFKNGLCMDCDPKKLKKVLAKATKPQNPVGSALTSGSATSRLENVITELKEIRKGRKGSGYSELASAVRWVDKAIKKIDIK